MTAIVQLPPPQGVTPIRVDRFSPYFNSPEKFGWSDLVPIDPYQHMHPMLSSAELKDIAYHFDALGGDINVTSYLGKLQDAVKNWKKQYRAGEGVYWDESLGVIIISGDQAKVIKKTAELAAVLKESYSIILDRDLLSLPGVNTNLLDELTEWGVLYREGDKYLNLAVRVGTS